MKKIFYCLVSFAILFILDSCKKGDTVHKRSPSEIEREFFLVSSGTNPTVQRIIDVIKWQNDKDNFIDKVSLKEGFAIWNKAEVYSKTESNSDLSRNEQLGPDTLILIPFVLKNKKNVNSILACRIVKGKLYLNLYRGRRYAFHGFANNTNSMTANTMALEFMYMDHRIFGTSVFSISDRRLFQDIGNENSKEQRYLTIQTNKGDSDQGSSQKTQNDGWDYYTVTRCYRIYNGQPQVVENIFVRGLRTTDDTEWSCYTTTTSVYISPNFSSMGSGGISIDNSGTTGGTSGSGNYGPAYSWWSNDPCPSETDWQTPDAPQCNGGDVLGWQSLYPLMNVAINSYDLRTPCLVAAKEKLPDFDLNIFTKNLQLQPAAENQQNWTIYLNEQVLENNGNIQAAYSEPDPVTKHWVVHINPKFFNGTYFPNSSQEYAAALILHEIIHGFLYVYMQSQGITEFNSFTHHEIMFRSFVTAMRDQLVRCFNMPAGDATALALQGMDAVLKTKFSGTFMMDYDEAMDTFAVANYQIHISDAWSKSYDYMKGNLGTKCF